MSPEFSGGAEQLEQESTEDIVIDLIAEIMEWDDATTEAFKENPPKNKSLKEDFDMDSLAMIEAIEEAERRFEVDLNDDARLEDIKTYGDVCAWVNEVLAEKN